MTKLRKLALLFVFPMMLSLVSCNSFLFESSTNITEAVPALHIVLKMGDTFQPENNPYIQALEEKLNIKLEVECPSPSSYNERLNVMMAMGDLPDIVQVNWSGEANMAMWVQNGYVEPIDLSQAPDIERNTPKALLAMMNFGSDGQTYAVPGITTSYPYGVIIRQDWLDTLGLETPHTLDEFVAVMQAFTENDPDGNQKDDTFGITSWKLNQIGGVFAGAFQTDYLWNSIHADTGDAQNVAKLRENQTGYLSFLDFVKNIYDQGYVDPSFVSLQNAENKFVLGKIGMIGGYSCDVITLEKQLQKTVSDAKLQWILCPGDEDGRVWNYVPESYGYNGAGSMFGENAIFFITKDADYDTALYFLNQMNTQEMILFANLGIQGIHYEVYDSNRNLLIRTEEQSKAALRDLWGISDTFRSDSYAYLGNNEEENTRLEYYRKKGYLLITNPYSYNMGLVSETIEFQKSSSNYKEYERSAAMQYITGEKTREEYIQEAEDKFQEEKSILSQKINEKYQQLTANVPIQYHYH